MSKYGLTDERYNQMMETYNNDEYMVQDVVRTWGAENCNKGYAVFNCDGTGMLEIEHIVDVGAFDSDAEAVLKAIEDGVKIIPIEELPFDMDDEYRYYGWIDTQENRGNIANYCK